jgi:dCMP deaminase
MRPKWDKIWIDLAIAIGKRSTCELPDRQVGCVIVSEDNSRVLALGYNGGAKGDNNLCDHQSSVGGLSRCSCVHAEMNALTKLNATDPIKKVMYLTLSPCLVCAKLLVNAGISELIYVDQYNKGSIEVFNILCNSGMDVLQYDMENRCRNRIF